jgi:phage terminase large subunit-like protein
VLHEWAVPEGSDVEDLELVKAANPFSGVTLDYLREKRELPGMTVAHWSRFTCNLASRSEYAAVQEREWADAASTEEIPAGAPVWLGLDVAWKWDTTAMVPLWWRGDEFRLFGPAVVLEPPRDGASLDPHLVEAALVELHARNPLHTVVMDTIRAEQLAAWISEEFGATVVDRKQTNALAVDDYERFMEALRQGWLRHSGDRALTRHVLNAVARVLPGGDARFDRPSSSRKSPRQQNVRVIDALVAAAMVHAQASGQTAVVEAWSEVWG